jgi:hypothetical protein
LLPQSFAANDARGDGLEIFRAYRFNKDINVESYVNSHAHQVGNLGNHAANFGPVWELLDPANAVQPEPDKRLALLVVRRMGLPICSTIRHVLYMPLPQPF